MRVLSVIDCINKEFQFFIIEKHNKYVTYFGLLLGGCKISEELIEVLSDNSIFSRFSDFFCKVYSK